MGCNPRCSTNGWASASMTIGINTLCMYQYVVNERTNESRQHKNNNNEKGSDKRVITLYSSLASKLQVRSIQHERLTVEPQSLPTALPAMTMSTLPKEARPKIFENEAKRLYPLFKKKTIGFFITQSKRNANIFVIICL